MRSYPLLAAASIAAVVLAVAPSLDAQPRAIDYADPATWLCRPGRTDACAADLATTIVNADGTMRREPSPAAAASPRVDCFYVYPTVSNDTTGNSDMTPGTEEPATVASQFARFRTVCRQFAPMYRQATLAALRAMLAGRTVGDLDLAYGDVRDAWRYYLAHDNGGRGVVLIGHSQGSRHLARLLHEEIDGKPIQQRIVSALLTGWAVAVPTGRDVGGDFATLPLCRASTQTGCIVAYSTFRDTMPPPAQGGLFAHAAAGHVAACTNPAALGGGSAPLHAYLAARRGNSIVAVAPAQWVTPPVDMQTPFVSVPGLLSARCVSDAYGSYLALTVHGDPADPRTDTIAGDIPGPTQRMWGLHLIDMGVVMGDLVDLVGRQSAAWKSGR